MPKSGEEWRCSYCVVERRRRGEGGLQSEGKERRGGRRGGKGKANKGIELGVGDLDVDSPSYCNRVKGVGMRREMDKLLRRMKYKLRMVIASEDVERAYTETRRSQQMLKKVRRGNRRKRRGGEE